MASARPHTTSSPRDHAADANPDLARKKQRIGLDDTRGSSPDTPVVIEADDPEDIGTNFANAIQIEDDQLSIMDPYSDAFFPNSLGVSPLDQLTQLHSDIIGNRYIDPNDFIAFGVSLYDHIQRTSDEPHAWAQRYLDDEADFFTKLAELSIVLLEHQDLFEPKTPYHPPDLRRALDGFLVGLQTLCHRIIPRLPEAIKASMSRRDSGQVATRQQTLGALYYLYLAYRILIYDPFLLVFFHKFGNQHQLEGIMQQNRAEFYTDDTVASLATIIRVLSGAMRDLKDAWLVLQSSLELFTMTVEKCHGTGKYPGAEVEEVLGVLNACILPAVCGKHPGALPHKFHERMVFLAAQEIQTYAACAEPDIVDHLYERFVESDIDALVPIPCADGMDGFSSLWRLVDGDQGELAELLGASWAMQAALQFIHSDIMDVRNVGISLLKDRLRSAYNIGRASTKGHEHPLIQYGVRFLRENEVISYIFGPESRAGLVGHSDDIVCFLAATGFHTDLETDIIWKACSTSVEADFVNAAFSILERVIQWLSPRQLIYLAQKYTTTPMDKLGTEALKFYERLLTALSTTNVGERLANLTLASTMIEVLKVASISPPSPSRDEMRRHSMSMIALFAQPGVALKEKVEIYKQCIPEIQQRSPHATAAVEILAHLLHVRGQPNEAEVVLAMLPVAAAVNELHDFVKEKRDTDVSASSSFDVLPRLDYIVHLLTLDPKPAEQETGDKLFDNAFGELALCNFARNQAWLKLNNLTKWPMTASVAGPLWKRYTQERILNLDAKFATPALLTFIGSSLKDDFASDNIGANPLSLLSLPLWKTLVRIANSAAEMEVVLSCVQIILDLLFKPNSPTSLVQCQCEFVRAHIQSLCDDCEGLIVNDESDAAKRFLQGVKILNSVLERSRAVVAARGPSPVASDTLVLTEDGKDAMTFVAQVYGANTHPRFIQITARPKTKVSELIAKLPEKTKALENRIIVGGREISLLADQTLEIAGIQPSGVIMISPKYTYHLDLDEVLTGPGPVEQVIVSQYHSLDKFLDGPDMVAKQAYDFLFHVRTSAQARMKVTAPGATMEKIFPKDKPWRTRMSLRTLQQHLSDFVKLGVADQDFISRTLRVLVAVVLDEGRPFDGSIMLEVALCLYIFFQYVSPHPRLDDQTEDPVAVDNVEIQEVIPHLEDPTAFISRMILLMFEALHVPLQRFPANIVLPLRTNLTITLYKALVEACRAHSSLWKLVVRHPSIVELHERLLLDEDIELSRKLGGRIRDLCRDITAPRDTADVYWDVIVRILSEAMTKSSLSEPYFSLMSEIVPLVHFGENDLRALIELFAAQLRSYRHEETTRVMVSDKAAAGLLTTLGLVITYLKSYKKPLHLDGLPTELMRRFLFPPQDDPEAHRLTSEDSRNLVYDLVKWTFEAPGDYDELVGLLCAVVPSAYREIGFRFPGTADFCRHPWDGAGLSNLGMTCYMNSLLQQLFANLQFRKFILDQPISDRHRQSVLHQTQVLFAYMQNDICVAINTERLAEALKIQIGLQEDVHTFYTALLGRLEESLERSEDKAALANFFTGKSITQIKGECEHVSTRTEPFTELSITVKNKTNLIESLDEFVQGEPLEGANKYKCMTCDSANGGRLINAVKRTCLEEVPDNLTCCLKRFTYGLEGEDKVNDRFEFPSKIDMSFYKRSHLEDPEAEREEDNFELVGVIVHQGSLHFGHYWSFVRVAGTKDTWLYLEDSRAVHCKGGLQEVQENCFGKPKKWAGGVDRTDSGYVLFYQRQSYMEQATSINMVPIELQRRMCVLPEVDLPSQLAKEIDGNNAFRQLTSSFFGNGFCDFIIWLMGQLPAVLRQRISKAKRTDDAIQPNVTGLSHTNTEAMLGRLIAEYMKRILPAHPQAEFKMDSFMTAVETIVEESPATACAILHGLSDSDGFAWANIVCHDQTKVRSSFFKIVDKCLAVLSENGPEVHERVSTALIHSCTSIIDTTLDSSRGRWEEYLAFVTRLASLEDGMLLERGYFHWALQIMLMRYEPACRKLHADLWNWARGSNNYLELGAVFEFIFATLNDHVDLLQMPIQGPVDFRSLQELRMKTPHGWVLQPEEKNGLMHVCNTARGQVWSIPVCASVHCEPPAPARWQDYAPGKLIGLLASKYAHPDWILVATDQLVRYFEWEENRILPMLMMALHYCRNRMDNECMSLMRALSKNLVQWGNSEVDCLWFYTEASKPDMAPVSVMSYISIFTAPSLGSKSTNARQKTATWLEKMLFGPPALSDDSALDSARVRASRTLCGHLQKTVRTAYEHEQRRGHFESMMDTLQNGKVYMTKLIEAVEKAVQGGHELDRGLRVEADEIAASLAGLTAVLDELQDWEPETTLPTRLLDVRTSVEEEEVVESDGVVDETSDDGLDDLSSTDPEI